MPELEVECEIGLGFGEGVVTIDDHLALRTLDRVVHNSLLIG
jgi:hypothetical protein